MAKRSLQRAPIRIDFGRKLGFVHSTSYLGALVMNKQKIKYLGACEQSREEKITRCCIAVSERSAQRETISAQVPPRQLMILHGTY